MGNNEKILLGNGRIIDPLNGLDQGGDILIYKGRIEAIVESGSLEVPEDCQQIDLEGKWLTPGLIDMHVHLREPGEEYKETIASGTRAAAAGGFTAVACMPNTRPVNDSEAVTSLIVTRAANCPARVYPVGAISKNSEGNSLAPFGEMKAAGAVALSDDGSPVISSLLMRRALEYGANYDMLIISHAEELSLSQNGAMNEGPLSTRMGLRGIPSVAETIMIYRDIALAEYLDRPVHIAHVSTREAVDLIRRAKERGVKVTAETAPHYFSLTEEAVSEYDTNAKMYPPLRSFRDREAVCQALQEGVLDAIASDHAPHSILEKDQEFEEAANGIIGLETAVPLTLSMVRKNILTPVRMIELMSLNPSRILGIKGGSLQDGGIADLTVIDPEKEFVYQADKVVSKSSNSPFFDWHMKGKAVLTIMDGKIRFCDI
ncbi:MAG: dihydroorotase [Thermodesulfobacteriota bacterium]